ncbi:MAG: sigma-70 family RNA polymerase sigma factor [Verrucomicrobiae bacterium]|nr:sigma-70 family RNA polymerase sigma factor [Verrucomicrobiae bacterium]
MTPLRTMPAASDAHELLRRFLDDGDESAFRELVEHFTPLVYGVARRKLDDVQLIEEVCQNVFVVLAGKALTVSRYRYPGAWIHRAATLETLKAARNLATRKRHLAMIENELKTRLPEDADWKSVRVLLDEALLKLPERDRAILIAHYFEERSFPAIAAQLGLNADAAQKRGARAIAKLARLLNRKGIAISAAALAAGLAPELAPAAPVGLAMKSASAALAATSSVGATTTLSASLIAMTTSHITTITTFALAALIPLGFRLTTASFKRVNEPAALRSPEVASTSRGPTTQVSQTSDFDPEWFRSRLQRLVDGDDRNDPDQADARRLQRHLFGLGEEDIAKAIAVLGEIEDPDFRLGLLVTAAFARFAELNPTAAVDRAANLTLERWGYYAINGAWQTWAFSDWDSAIRWLAGTKTEFDHVALVWGVLDQEAKLDGRTALRWAEELAEDFPRHSESLYERALSAWTLAQPEAAIAWMDENLRDPVRRDQRLGNALESLGTHAPAQALDQVDLIENPERRREVSYNLYWQWALIQPDESATYLAEAFAHDRTWDTHFLWSAGEALARNAPERALEIARMARVPQERDALYGGILSGAAFSDYTTILEAADAISAETARTNNCLQGFLTDWWKRDPTAAVAWVDAMPEGDKKSWVQHIMPR